jgi:four helix bundle protein
LREKSLAFAVCITEIHTYLCEEEKECILSRHLLRAGTEIGMNVAEAFYAPTRREFTAKMMAALNDAAETRYWLRLLECAKLLKEDRADCLLRECRELERMLATAVNTNRIKLQLASTIYQLQ